jgi:hypothetical protein
MDKGILAAAWIGMYILCCVLGFLPEQQGFSRYVMTAVSVCFFIPPFLLLHKAKAEQDDRTLRLVRRISILSLSLSTVLLVANFLSVLSASEALGTVLHIALSIVSVPMGSSGGIISLFLWACLLYTSIPGRKKKK